MKTREEIESKLKTAVTVDDLACKIADLLADLYSRTEPNTESRALPDVETLRAVMVEAGIGHFVSPAGQREIASKLCNYLANRFAPAAPQASEAPSEPALPPMKGVRAAIERAAELYRGNADPAEWDGVFNLANLSRAVVEQCRFSAGTVIDACICRVILADRDDVERFGQSDCYYRIKLSAPAPDAEMPELARWLHEMHEARQINDGHVAFAVAAARRDLQTARERSKTSRAKWEANLKHAALVAEQLRAENAKLREERDANTKAAAELEELREFFNGAQNVSMAAQRLITKDKDGYRRMCALLGITNPHDHLTDRN